MRALYKYRKNIEEIFRRVEKKRKMSLWNTMLLVGWQAVSRSQNYQGCLKVLEPRNMPTKKLKQELFLKKRHDWHSKRAEVLG